MCRSFLTSSGRWELLDCIHVGVCHCTFLTSQPDTSDCFCGLFFFTFFFFFSFWWVDQQWLKSDRSHESAHLDKIRKTQLERQWLVTGFRLEPSVLEWLVDLKPKCASICCFPNYEYAVNQSNASQSHGVIWSEQHAEKKHMGSSWTETW